MARKDPLPVFCFKVQVPGYSDAAFFKSVSGLRFETEVVPVREGGQNLTTYQLVGATKWSNLVLKQGFTKSSGLLAWREEWTKLNENGRIAGTRVPITITQLNTAMVASAQWVCERGWPMKWEVGEFDASKNELSIETLEIAHEGIEFEQLAGE